MSDSNQPRLLSFTLSGSSILGDEVSVSLTDGVAVLVGRNGAGKSAILEGFEAIASSAIGKFNRNKPEDESIPKDLTIRVLTPSNRTLQYWYRCIPSLKSDLYFESDELNAEDLGEKFFSWDDKCEYLDEQREVLWNTKNGETTFWDSKIKQKVKTISIGGGTTFSNFKTSEILELGSPPDERYLILDFLKRLRLLGKDPVRRFPKRSKSILEVSELNIQSNGFEMSDKLSNSLFLLNEVADLREIESVCQRIGLGNKIKVMKYFSHEEIEEREYFSQVFVDGVNIGFLSDGTLRVLSILVEIITSLPGATIMIEEPEMQLHPGMLSRFLNEIEAYTYGKNLIISTHSPQVVSWTSPDKINLVHRENGKTIVRKLGENEINSVYQYLSDEGTLGELVYSGFLDEDE